MVSILLQNLLITRQVHIKTLTQGGTYLAKSTDAKLEIQFSSDADKMWVEEYPLTCMYAERGMLDMMGFISGEQELAKQGGGEGGGRGPSTKVKWGQGWNNDKLESCDKQTGTQAQKQAHKHKNKHTSTQTHKHKDTSTQGPST